MTEMVMDFRDQFDPRIAGHFESEISNSDQISWGSILDEPQHTQTASSQSQVGLHHCVIHLIIYIYVYIYIHILCMCIYINTYI